MASRAAAHGRSAATTAAAGQSAASVQSALSPLSAPAATSPGPPAPAESAAAGESATAAQTPQPSAGTSAPAGPVGTPVVSATDESARVGALFSGSVSGGHFCSASVVHSDSKDLLVTAAHCLSSVGDTVFIPGYHDGQAPYGTWKLTQVLVSAGWSDNSDPDLDFAFAVVAPNDGKRIEDVVGASTLGLSRSFTSKVDLYGYPSSTETPVVCSNVTSQFGSYQRRIACPDFSGGTSGGPWITSDGAVIGVIGGYQQGGDTDDVSYSAYFDKDAAALYDQALKAAS